MRIVILDAYTLNTGDLSWEEIEKLGETSVYDRTPAELVLERSKDAEIVLTNKTILNASIIDALPSLKYIGVIATGYNVVDIEAAQKRGIIVTNAPAYGSSSVAQFTFALILELANKVGVHNESVKKGEWSEKEDFSYWKAPLIGLSGKTLGIIGLGKIGSEVAKIAMAFGLKVLASHKHPERDQMEGVKFVSTEEVFSQSDFISLHCPLTSANQRFVNKQLLNTMKKSAFLINTARGPLVNEADLVEALETERIAGAALDVLSIEPPPLNHPLLSTKNCIITPHIAWATKEARQRLLEIVTENIQAFIKGNPKNVVS